MLVTYNFKLVSAERLSVLTISCNDERLAFLCNRI